MYIKKASEFLSNIKERFTNPLIFSFLCSWVVFNWEILLSLLWYDSKQIEKEGCRSIYEFIGNQLAKPHTVSYPIFFAIIYTLGSPIVRNLIQAFNSWAFQWGNKWNLKIMAGGKIGIEKYIQLRDDWKARTLLLEKVITEENQYKKDFQKIETELLETKVKFNDLQQKELDSSNYIQQLHDMRILDGTWINTYELKPGEKGTEDVVIQNGQYYIITSYGQKELLADIRDFSYDNRNQNVFFTKELSDSISKGREKEKYNMNRLMFQNKDLLTGTENGTTRIEYRRK